MELGSWHKKWLEHPSHPYVHWSLLLVAAGGVALLVIGAAQITPFQYIFTRASSPALSSDPPAPTSPPMAWATDHIIVKLKTGKQADAAFLNTYKLHSPRKLLKEFKPKGLAKKSLEDAGLTRIELIDVQPGTDPQAIVDEVKKDPGVEYAELDYVISVAALPTDQYFSNQWNLHNTGQSGGAPDADIDAPEAWNVATGGPSVVTAVIDSGIDYNHPDLASRIWTNPGEIAGNGIDDDQNGFIDDVRGWDFKNNDNDPMDDTGHGTHVAGIIAATGNNAIGTTGVNWNGSIAALKAIDAQGYVSGATQATSYAIMMGVKVINASYGGLCGGCPTTDNTITAANNAGILFVAAAGNNSNNNDTTAFYPASDTNPNVISVAATDRFDEFASFSNYGATSVDLAAPGFSIFSTTPQSMESYGWKSGTSMATPHVAGAAALLWAYNPTLTMQQVKNTILSSVDVLPSLQGKMVAGGRLNIARMLGVAVGSPSPTPSSAPTSTPTPTATPTPTPTSTPPPTATPLPTPTPIPDTTKPTVSITSPANGASVTRNANVTITASAADNIAVTRVEFSVSGALTCTDTLSPYSCVWKVPGAKKTYTVTAKAYDAANNSATSTITVSAK